LPIRENILNQTSLANATQSSNALDNVYTFQQFQTFYHKITGKKEQLRKIYNEPYQIDFKDLEDLHHRIIQAAETYHIETRVESVTSVYDDNSSKIYSSFERFKSQADVGNTALKSVSIEYNIAIRTTQSNDFNSYKIKIDIISGVAVFSDVQKEIPKIFWKGFGYITGKANVEYVDYAIAQNFINVINVWFESRTQASKNKVIDWVQYKSHYIPRIIKLISLTVCALMLGKIIGNQVNLSSNQELAKFAIFSCVCIWFITEVIWLIGKAIEQSIDKIWNITFIDLNEGDRKLIQKVREHNKKCKIIIMGKFAIFIFTTFISVVLQYFLSKII
jgi:hypothetical protein